MKPIDRSVADPERRAGRRRSGTGPAVRPSRRELTRAGRWRVWGPVALRAAALGVALLGLAGIGSVVGRASPLSEPTLSRAGLKLGALSTQALALVGSGGVGRAGVGTGELAGAGGLGSTGGLGSAGGVGGGGAASSSAVPGEPFDVTHSGACPCACVSGTKVAALSGPMASASGLSPPGLPGPRSTGSAASASGASALSLGPAPLPGSAVGARGEARRAGNELPVVLNRADAVELRRLPGVGAKRAEAIILLRQRLGRFQRASDLLRVRGIGPRTLERMLPHLVLD